MQVLALPDFLYYFRQSYISYLKNSDTTPSYFIFRNARFQRFFAKPSFVRRQIKNPSLFSIGAFYATENSSSIICDKMSSFAYQRAEKFQALQNSKICILHLLRKRTIRWKN